MNINKLKKLSFFCGYNFFIYKEDKSLYQINDEVDIIPSKYLTLLVIINNEEISMFSIIDTYFICTFYFFDDYEKKYFIVLYNASEKSDKYSELIEKTRERIIFIYYYIFNDFPKFKHINIFDNNFKDLDLDYNKFIKKKHNNYNKEIFMLEAIKEGRIDKFKVTLIDFIQSGKFGNMSKNNKLRNDKNIIIAFITLATRYSIKGGLYPEEAFNLSDKLVQKIEGLDNISNINMFFYDIGEKFILKLKENKKIENSAVINSIKEYIYMNLYEKILLEDIASSLGYSKQYICRILIFLFFTFSCFRIKY